MDKIIEVTQIILPFIIGGTVAYIAYQQYKLSKFKTKHGLYEKRLPIYKSVMQFIIITIKQANVKIEDAFKLNFDTSESRFLFKKEVKNYIDELYSKGFELRTANTMMDNLREDKTKEEEYKRYCDIEYELLNWFHKQIDEADKIFSPYLKIDKIL